MDENNLKPHVGLLGREEIGGRHQQGYNDTT